MESGQISRIKQLFHESPVGVIVKVREIESAVVIVSVSAHI